MSQTSIFFFVNSVPHKKTVLMRLRLHSKKSNMGALLSQCYRYTTNPISSALLDRVIEEKRSGAQVVSFAGPANLRTGAVSTIEILEECRQAHIDIHRQLGLAHPYKPSPSTTSTESDTATTNEAATEKEQPAAPTPRKDGPPAARMVYFHFRLSIFKALCESRRP